MFTLHITLATLVTVALLPKVAMESCDSAGTPGLPGIPGIPGRDGWEGQKGEKGEPGLPLKPGLVAQTGQKGERGPAGPPGKIGRNGVKGFVGIPGSTGPRGNKGSVGVHKLELQSAFCVTRRTKAQPTARSPVRFSTVITNLNGHFNIDTGKFVCHIPGTYYFVYHASAVSSLCVSFIRDGQNLASFCDHVTSDGTQVSSGGLTVYLNKDQAVWLETNDNNGMIGVAGKQSVFSGFMLYPH
ncbi:hypothetical protein SKAU_G00326650 [Synaphobranchus kaupii]|uniref:C1q domain-containing protein n=1 Tax=Synaphobranchus kaupii TaxID=118154 RepID=A0A9Q1IK34_SYNKA|nr:hypothetical protein SKAU_G00326650 [Synaphobranchus kaupii]